MCLPNFKNLTFSKPFFWRITHPPVYQFLKKITKFCPNWMLFSIICSKYTQFLNLGSFVSDETFLIGILNFTHTHTHKNCPKRQAHIHLPSQYETPPRWEPRLKSRDYSTSIRSENHFQRVKTTPHSTKSENHSWRVLEVTQQLHSLQKVKNNN